VVEVVPPAVQDELEALREKDRQRKAADEAAAVAMKREGAEYTFRVLYEQFTAQYTKLTDAIKQMTTDNQAKYETALQNALQKMIQMLQSGQEAERESDD